MTKKISLREVDAENWEEVVDLELEDEQEDYVASNAYSLAESKYNSYAVPRAIYAGKKVVGFLMYETLHEEDEPETYSIYRFMIDRRWQGKGYGRRALEQTLKDIGKRQDCRRITICYVPNNKTAKAFYASLGFEEVGLDDDGEMIAEIRTDPVVSN
ncbi:MAG: GNAT family N-acetyltransferase [Pseudomonadota bacterium]